MVPLSILKNDHTPFYLQIAQLIRDKILSGEYPIDSKIPSEDEIVKQFGVSRMTARNAVTELVNQGLVYRIHGKGAFVARTKMERNLSKLTGFYEDMRAMGVEPSSKVLRFERRLPRLREQYLLQIQKNQEVFFVERIRYMNQEPIGLQELVTPVHLVPDLDKVNLEKESFYQYLKDIGRPLEKADQRMEAKLAPEVSRKMGLHEDTPYMYFERISFAGGVPIEYLRSHFCGNFYSIHVTLYP